MRCKLLVKCIQMLLVLTANFSFSVNLDSLKLEIAKDKKDTLQVNRINMYANHTMHMNPAECYPVLHRSRSLASRLNYKKGFAEAVHMLGMYFDTNGGDSAIYYLTLAEKTFKEMNDVQRTASVYITLGTHYETGNDFKNALHYYLKALKIFEILKIDKGIAPTCMGLGNVFYNLKNFKKSKEYAARSLKHYEIIKSPYASWAMNNLANACVALNEDDEAIRLYEKSLTLKLEQQDYYGAVFTINDLGHVYWKNGDLQKALEQYERSLMVCRTNKLEKEPFANTYQNLAKVYVQMKKYDKAKPVLDSMQFYIKDLNYEDMKIDFLKVKSNYYEGTGKYREACALKNEYIALKDSVFTNEVNRIVTEADTKYASEKKQKEIEILNKDKKITDLLLQENKDEINRQRTILFSSIFAGIFLILAIILLINRNKLKQKANERLNVFNAELQEQKSLVEEKQKEILDSIHYAKRIQNSLLTSERYIAKTLNKLKPPI